jgi:hypothetical protein
VRSCVTLADVWSVRSERLRYCSTTDLVVREQTFAVRANLRTSEWFYLKLMGPTGKRVRNIQSFGGE